MSDTVPPPTPVDHDNAYSSLVEAEDDVRWAFGTGFDDPLAGVDTSLPSDVDAAALARYCLMLGDDALVYSQRLSQWCTNAPELEEEVALANIALDLLGQARLLLARAAAADPTIVPALPEGSPVPPEDALAFFRDDHAFRNVHLVEIDNGDFAESVARMVVFATWRLALVERLTTSADPVLAAVAAKGAPELTYHRDYASRWCVTLAQGTDLSRERMTEGLRLVWPYVEELFRASDDETALVAQGVAVDPTTVRDDVTAVLDTVLGAADLPRPDVSPIGLVNGRAGRDGMHTEALSRLLAEMQSVARAHPMGRW